MGFLLDKTQDNTVGVIAEIPETEYSHIVAQFFNTFDDDETNVAVDNIRQMGSWLMFEVTAEKTPNRSGNYRVDFHTAQQGRIAFKDLDQTFAETFFPLRDLQGLAKDIMFARTVAEIKNATNAMFEKHGRVITYAEKDRTETYASKERDITYNTNYGS